MVHRRLPGFQLASLGFLLQGIGAALFALSPTYPLSLIAALPIGLGFSFNTPVLNSRLQELSPEEFRGRVMGAYMLTWGLMPLGSLPMGVIADRIGTPAAVAGGAVISSVLAGILGLTSSSVRDV